jgi:hypothetical protein
MKTAGKAFLAAALFVAVAAAQSGGPPPGGPHGRGGFGGGLFGPGMHGGKVVTGAPYTATATDTFTQTLSNGNSITRTTTATVVRDSAGRTYESQTFNGGPLGANGPKTVIFINDPIAGYAYVLNPATMTGTQRALHTPPAGTGGGKGTHTGTPPNNPNVVVTNLTPNGPVQLNGVTDATGKQITRTIPAGTVGNAQPIVSTDTIYSSTGLQVVVQSKRSDPRTGNSDYELNVTSLSADESLFNVSGYTLTTAKGGGFGPRGQGRPQIK